jgi:PKD repeat protein
MSKKAYVLRFIVVAVAVAALTTALAASLGLADPLEDPFRRPYGADAPWNVPVADIPIHPESTSYRDSLWNDACSARPGNFNVNLYEYTYPVYYASDATGTYLVESGWGNMNGEYMPWNAAWSAAGGTDAQVIVLDPSTGDEWNLWQVEFYDNVIHASNANLVEPYGPETSGSYWTKEYGFPPSRGVGIQYLAMLVRPEEIYDGVIRHGLSMPIMNTSGEFYVAPATKLEHPENPPGIPEGMRFALDVSDQDIQNWLDSLPSEVNSMKPFAEIFAKALRDYGWFITDTAGGAHLQLECEVTAASDWTDIGIHPLVETGGKEYPRDLLDGLMQQNRIYTLVPSDEYPAMSPAVYFFGSPQDGSAPLTVDFLDLTANSPTSWSWTFGDGGSSNAQNPSHSYTSSGDYTVSLTATNAQGQDTLSQTDYVSVTGGGPQPPVAEFSGSPTSGDYPLTVDFTDLSSNSPTSWDWDFGDGGSSAAQDPSHEYTGAGDYTVSLTAANAQGQDTETKTDYISVSEPGGEVTIFSDGFEAEFAGWATSGTVNWYTGTPKNGTHGIEMIETSSMEQTISTAGYQGIKVSFYMGADSFEPEHGDHARALWYDGSTWTELIYIGPGDPEEDGQLHYLQYSLPAGAEDNADFALRFEINASWSTDYTYVDDVVVKGSTGGPPPAPVADFSGNPTSGDAPLTVNFSDLSTNSPTSWDWTFGDTGSSSAQSPSHEYTSASDYTVSLTAANAGGEDTETKTNYISVSQPAPVADFSGSPLSGDAPLTVNFTDSSTNTPTSWSWTFGDGGSSSAQNPSHEYTSASDYTVSLTATNAGGEDSETKTDYISVSEPPPPPPVADFSGSPLSGDAPLTVNFTDSSTNTPTSWSWTFGDGGSSTAQNPSHEYTSASDYTVSLTAANAGGEDTETKTNYISVSEPPPPPPVADFSAAPLSGDYSLTVDFTDLSTNTPTSWDWDFGDGGSSAAQNPSHEYTSASDYTVSLTSANVSGQDTETKSNYIHVTEPSQKETVFSDDFESSLDWTETGNVEWYTDSPKNGTHSVHLRKTGAIEKTISTAGYQAIRVSFYLGAHSLDKANENVEAHWYDGSNWNLLKRINNGDPEEDQQLHFFQYDLSSAADDNGSFALRFRINGSGTGDHGYVDDVLVEGESLGPQSPVADFSGSPVSGDYPLTVSFTDLSSYSPTSWSWTFGDTGTSTARNPSHEYTSAADYTVSLTAANAQGQDTETKSNYISVTEPSGQETIFSEDFESGFTWYTEGSTTWYTGDPKIGTHSVQMQGGGTDCWTNKTIGTVGYTDIVFRVYCGAKSYEASETLYIYWMGGGTHTLDKILSGDPEEDGQLHFFEFSLPSEADNRSDFGVAFYQVSADTGDYAYIDNVEILGTPQ